MPLSTCSMDLLVFPYPLEALQHAPCPCLGRVSSPIVLGDQVFSCTRRWNSELKVEHRLNPLSICTLHLRVLDLLGKSIARVCDPVLGFAFLWTFRC